MTKYSDATARAKFDACGYGDTCEFVKVEGDMFTARCRECGYEFAKDNSALRKPQKRFRCPACRERKISNALRWYEAGYSAEECAELFGLSKNIVVNYATTRKVRGGNKDNTEHLRALSAKGTAVLIKRTGESVRHTVVLHGFEMLEEWRGKGNTYRVRCMKCGCEFELKDFTLKACKFVCPECPDQFAELRDELDTMRDTVNWFGKELAQAMRELDKLDRWAGQLDKLSPQIATCKHCGNAFRHWPSNKRYGRRVTPMYCSKRCCRRANKQPSNIGHRLRKNGNAKAPRDAIKLRELYNKCGGICYLCGEPTDWNDYTKKPNGEFWYINGRYPTIDHIVPISKGGTHTWGNVRLAHRDCNSTKGTHVLLHGVTQ